MRLFATYLFVFRIGYNSGLRFYGYPILVMNLFLTSASTANLTRLCLIRVILLTGLGVSILVAHWQSIQLANTSIITTLLVLATYTAACWWRAQQSRPVTDQEFLGHIVADIAFLATLLYLSGGATNPFVSYYLVPLSISAITLPWAYTLGVALLGIGAYSALLFFYIPVTIFAPSHHSTGINIHIVGMWINFVFSAGLISFFVVGMANTVRQQQQTINQQKEDSLRNEQIMAVATLAAGTAHELGTPLATMNVLLEELNKEQHPQTLQDDIALLLQQVERCKGILSNLTTTAQNSHGEQITINSETLLREILSEWQVMRPEADVDFSVCKPHQAPNIASDTTLKQAITNLLNNAADACPNNIQVALDWNSSHLKLSIEDNGPGIPLELANQIYKPFITTKGKGLGLGLSLSHATIERFGGTVALFNKQAKGAITGTITQLQLPTSIGVNNV